MLKIYGGDLSSPSNKVKFVANALGLDFEFHPVKIREGENRKEWFLKLSPAGKIPAIDDGGFTLFESGAICQYLCRKHGSDLYPQNIKECALIDQWADFSTIHVGAAMSRVLYNRVFAPIIKVAVDENSLKDGLNFLGKFLPVVDAQLGKSEFLALDHLTLADITLLAVLDPAEVAGVDLRPYTHITKWQETLKGAEFYQKTHKEYGGPLKVMTAEKK